MEKRKDRKQTTEGLCDPAFWQQLLATLFFNLYVIKYEAPNLTLKLDTALGIVSQ